MKNKGKWFLLAARIIVGLVFIYAGWMKVSAMDMTVGYFAQMGLPAFLAYIVGYVEFVGGAFLVLGLFPCITGAILAVIMIFAVWYSRSLGLQGMMPPAVVFAALLGILGSVSATPTFNFKKKGGAEM